MIRIINIKSFGNRLTENMAGNKLTIIFFNYVCILTSTNCSFYFANHYGAKKQTQNLMLKLFNLQLVQYFNLNYLSSIYSVQLIHSKSGEIGICCCFRGFYSIFFFNYFWCKRSGFSQQLALSCDSHFLYAFFFFLNQVRSIYN